MTFRYSTISDYHKCNRYYELKHILGEDDGSDKAGELKFGSAIHLGIQDLFEGGNGLDLFETFWQLQESKGLQYSVYNRMSHADHMKLGKTLLEVFADEHKKHFEPLFIEQKMLGNIGGHSFGGTADFIGTYKGTLSLVDWKTSSQPYDNYKLVHNEQIYGYVELARQDVGVVLTQGVYGVAIKDKANPRWQFKVAQVTPEKMASVLENIKLVCDDIADKQLLRESGQGAFYKNPNQCVQGKKPCPFFSKCFGSAKDGSEGKKEETA